MTRVKKDPARECSQCGGKHYVLNNHRGWLRAEVCGCFQCPHCEGEGRCVHQDERGQSFLIDCECRVFQKRLGLLNDAAIPGKFKDAELETYETQSPFHASQKQAKSRAQDFVADCKADPAHFHRGLVFMGGPGRGKTHLAVGILKKLVMEAGVACKFVDFFQLLSDIRHAYSQDQSEGAVIQPYIQAPVLVVDELAKGRNTEWELTVLDQFISRRYNAADKVTIFTSNYPNKEPAAKKKAGRKEDARHLDTAQAGFVESYTHETLQERIGERTYSRLLEMCDFIHMQGPDFRIITKPHTLKK